MQLEVLTGILSIDRIYHDTIFAFANERDFQNFVEQKIPFEIIPAISLTRSTGNAEAEKPDWRTHYPSYPVYLGVMDSFALSFPGLCQLTSLTETPGGHELLVMKIGSPAGSGKTKPSVLLTSSIHGDEPLGYVLLLRLIEMLLGQYGKSSAVTSLADSIDIYINPLANPDGTFFISDSTIYGATRFNANHIDLNRNFPDPVKGDHPDSYGWQKETEAMMKFMNNIHPVLSANFHGGSEVVNYPWDCLSQLHADDTWYRMISRQWADSAQAYGFPGYMTAQDNGITNGYDWYPVHGGRQDYVNYFIHGREVTIELSDNKIPDENTLDNYWNYNFRSLLQYIEQAGSGFSGIVSDSLTGMPVKAMILIPGHDAFNSQVYSDSASGYFCRLAGKGDYVIEISAPGYTSRQIRVSVEKGRLTHTRIKLTPQKEFFIYPNPFSDVLRINISEPGRNLELRFTDLTGRVAKIVTQPVQATGTQEIRIKGIAPGMYMVEITYGDRKTSERILRIP
jgi:hypothetical protein